jgi:N-acetylneuraminic acid mutarotase
MKSPPSSSSIQCGFDCASSRTATILLCLPVQSAAVILVACLCLSARAQTGEWAWMGGSSTVPCSAGFCTGQPGAYGALGTFAAGNIPGGRDSASSWTDSGGNFWLFGGGGYDSAGTDAPLNDLWEFNPIAREWRWMGGSDMAVSSGVGQSGVYGTLGTPAAGNIPGGRLFTSNWEDGSGHLWLFGGNGFDADGVQGDLNDLWEFNPSTNEWAWLSGSSTRGSTAGRPGVYGTLGTFAAGNVPGGRVSASSWTDRDGHLWLFGGDGFDAKGVQGVLNDLWEFDPSAREWAWRGGGSTVGHSGIYGKLGTPAPANLPGSRESAMGWTDLSGNFWLFGGNGLDSNGNQSELNDLWEFDPSTKEWAWMGGSSAICAPSGSPTGCPGVYGTLGTLASGNLPGSRGNANIWKGSAGEIWLFGGYGFDANGIFSFLNDLWEFNPSTNEWAWLGGNSKFGEPGVYGKLGTFAAGNIPGDRHSGSSWIDSDSHLWLFGGNGSDAKGDAGELNDLWENRPAVLLSPAAEPTFKLAPGTYLSTQRVKIADAIPGATIHYTLDGSTPTKNSAQYKTALSLDETTTVKAIAEATGYTASAVAEAKYIILKPQTITFTPPAAPATYGVKPFDLSAKSNSGLPVQLSVISGPATIKGHLLTITGAGTVVIAANQKGNSDYAPANEVKRNIAVEKAKLTVTAASLTIKTGDPIPTLTYSIKGFVNGDKQKTATTGEPKLTTTATSSSAPGSYPIKIAAGTLAAKNYDFTYVDGTLTIQ